MTPLRLDKLKHVPWGIVLCALIGMGSVGIWFAAESGLLFPYAPNGTLGTGWHWMFLRVYKGIVGQVLWPGILFVGASLLLGWSRRRATGLSFSPASARAILFPALLLAMAELGSMAMQRQPAGTMAVYSYMAMLICGRLCAGAMLWEAAGLGSLFRSLVRAPGRAPSAALAALAIAPLLFLRGIPIEPTGDEPSYISYALSIITDYDIKFTPNEIEKINLELGLPAEHKPHFTTRPNGSLAPGHFLGPSIVIIPACLLGRLFHAIIPACHLWMLAINGITLMLAALFAMKLTRLPGPSVIAACILGVSFPMLGMSYQIYPEPMIALLTLVAFTIMADAFAGRRPLSQREAVWALVICGLLPWFHSKFVLLSAIIGLFVFILQLPCKPRSLLAPLGALAATSLVFLAVHFPIYGDFLWKQSLPTNNGKYDFVAMFTDSNHGFLPYVPWAIFLPLGAFALWRRAGKGRYPLAVLCAWAAIVVPASMLSREGYATALRYFTPIIVLTVPFLAAAMAVMNRRSLFVLCAIVTVPINTAIVFFNDPWTAYSPLRQAMRRVLDETFTSFSWRELFPHLKYMTTGVDTPGALPHGTTTIGICVALALIFTLNRTFRSWNGVLGTVAATFALLVSAQIFDCPNWGVTASRMFEAQCRQFALAQELRPGAIKRLSERNRITTGTLPLVSLDLNAGLKPIEREFESTPYNQKWYHVPLSQGDGFSGHGAALQLPRGFYRMQIWGGLNPTDDHDSTGELRLFVNGLSPEKTPTTIATWPGAPSLRTAQIGHPVVLLETTFEVPKEGAKIDHALRRLGNIDFNYEVYSLDYLGLTKPSP